MDLVALGLSLRSAPLSALEALSERARIERAEERMRALPGVREAVRVVTCHRALLLLGVSHPLQRPSVLEPLRERSGRNASSEAGSVAAASHRCDDPACLLALSARRILADEAGLSEMESTDAVVAHVGEDAFRHLVRLACGLESPIEGETEILGQLRAAYAAAVERGAAGRITGGAMHRVFRAARRIRAYTGFATASPSWGEHLADTIFAVSSLASGDEVQVLGSGALSRSLTAGFLSRGVRVENGPRVESRTEAPSVRRARVLVTASGRGRIVSAADLGLEHRSESLEIWDLGMPRNVDPAVATRPGVRLRTLADVPALAAASAARADAMRQAATLVEDEVASWREWRRERSAARTLVRLGRLLELSAAIPDGGAPASDRPDAHASDRPDAHAPEFRKGLLAAFRAIAQESRDEDEAASRLALFEDALRRAASQRETSDPDRAILGGIVHAAASVGHGTAGSADAASEPRPRQDGSKRARRHQPGSSPWAGTVSLVGAGPGRGGLLTLDGASRLAAADVVYHDALAGHEVLVHCRPEARLVDVGKRRGRASATQREIEASLVREARAGLAVVRLKGGDPFVFGRGGEEALALRRAGVPFDVVPGVSSGIGATALAGIPITHRGLSGSAAFVTAHDLGDDAQGAARRERLGHLARGAETLVVFMAGAELGRVRRTLLDAGLADDTPAAVIESGTTPDQRVSVGTLGGLEDLAAGRGDGPELVVVGRTVSLSSALASGTSGDPAVPLEDFEESVCEVAAMRRGGDGRPSRAVSRAAGRSRRGSEDRRRAG